MAGQLPPWATTAQGAPRPPWLSYLTGATKQVAPYRPPTLPYLPSVQQLNQLNPSERSGYGGYLSDNKSGLGLHPEDVYWLMQKLAPRGYSAGPRWAGMR